MTDPRGVCLLPASGEWVYDPLPHRARRVGDASPSVQNCYAAPGGAQTDSSLALDQLQATYPGCTTVSLVVAWFASSTDVAQCRIYPSTTFIGGSAELLEGGTWTAEPWRCSGLTQASTGLIPLSQSGGSYVYGGTPSDPSVVRCIRDLKARGLRVVFYPFLLMDAPGYPWRGRIAYAGADVSAAATAAVTGFLGPAAPAQFTRDGANLTVAYAGAPTDWTFRRMILHYAHLCVVAGGVDLFLVGSELRGLEAVRGPLWTKAGAAQADGSVTWDYPFVAGLMQLATDVRGIFDDAGLARDSIGLTNLVAYSPDWSSWMGLQHAGADGQWPHLDQLYAHSAIDLVSFDNYLPLSDWAGDDGGLDACLWVTPAAATWPPSAAAMNGLGLSGPPLLASKAYLKANIEGGEKCGWFYRNSDNLGRGADPGGSLQQVSRPAGDRLSQTRSPYDVGQEILAPKMLRWWWNNPHRAVYDAGDGQGWAPHGPPTAWVVQSKPITFSEYGFPTCDRCTNQPNVFYDPKSSESFTPYWSAWEPAEGGWRPKRDDTLASLARDAVVEYWTLDGRNATSAAGVTMVEPTFMCAWNWDARPFPAFPQLGGLFGDAGNWRVGTWIGGKGPSLPPVGQGPVPQDSVTTTFPALLGLGWSVAYAPTFITGTALYASGRESRAARNAAPLWEIQMRFDVLTDDIRIDVQTLVGFYGQVAGSARPFLVAVAPELGFGASDHLAASIPARRRDDEGLASDTNALGIDWGLASQATAMTCRFAEDQLDVEQFAAHLFATRAVRLRQVRS